MAPHPQRLTVTHRAWPLKTSRGVETAVPIVVVEIADGDSRGRAECVPMRRFGESIESVLAALDAMKGAVSAGLARDTLQKAMPPGAARNALDCAFWAIEANRSYVTVAELAGLGTIKPVETAFTLAFDTPDAMAEQAAAHRTRPLFKLELGGEGDMERVRAVRQAGMELCSGGIVGMGEEDADVVRMAFELRDLGVESIPVNFLNPIDGTPLAGSSRLNPRYCLKVLAMFRLANPSSEIRIAGGREMHLRGLQPLGLYAANSIFVGDYLTTPGQPPEADYRMIEDMGFVVTKGEEVAYRMSEHA